VKSEYFWIFSMFCNKIFGILEEKFSMSFLRTESIRLAELFPLYTILVENLAAEAADLLEWSICVKNLVCRMAKQSFRFLFQLCWCWFIYFYLSLIDLLCKSRSNRLSVLCIFRSCKNRSDRKVIVLKFIIRRDFLT